ncbi:MAG: LysR family transcriptional regulator [Candidatus Dormibacteraeota bacterium]|uniref:LysR family transcriptional regulator n=1 Tax=Candidatus Amunia macphersoniae TaxID=3127014 RepID=A0A934KK03_9BACT|nr:LysR family transcriptional regulator [Candidatus Dormibacteraeota bacterium]
MSSDSPPLGSLSRARRNSVLAVTAGQLRTFAAVAELGSVRAGAEQLNVTESAVSASVASLQRQIGAALIERAGRGVRLTPAGVRYAERVRHLLGELEAAAMAALGEASPDRGWLRIAAVSSVAEVHLPDLLAGFRGLLPDVGVELEVAPRNRVWSRLRGHHVDLAVAGRPPLDSGMVTYAVHANDLVIVATPGRHGVRGHETAWLLREPGSGMRATLESILHSLGNDAPCLTLGSHGAVIAGAVAGLGATLVARETVVSELAGGRLVEVPLPGTPLSRPFHLVGQLDLPPMARRFVDHVLASGEWRSPSVSAPGRPTPLRRVADLATLPSQ